MTKKVPQATHDGVLIIGDSEISCYVLENEDRILSTRGIMKSLGRTWRGRKYSGTELPVFIEAKNLKLFVEKHLASVPAPTDFRTPSGGMGEGFTAEMLPAVCDVYLDAREEGVLTVQQLTIAKKCEILARGLARIGIIALVDEATGYQDTRAKNALAKILEKFIAKELQSWTRTFPEEFYKEMFRLRDWSYPALVDGTKPARPSVVGKYTNDLVYERIAPGVLKELRRKNPKTPDGHRRSHHHRWFTTDYGHPKLKEHLASVIALMRASSGWDQFIRNMNRALPRMNETIEMPFDD